MSRPTLFHCLQSAVYASASALLLAPILLLAQPAETEPTVPLENEIGSPRSSVPPAPGGRVLRFRVLDADNGRPLPGVKVRTWVRANLVTDINGNCDFPLPKSKPGDFYYRIHITKDGYVPKYISWSRIQKDTIESMPTDYTARMERSITIGGIAKSQTGQPIPDAKIIISGPPQPRPEPRERTTIAPNFHSERTDEHGRWHWTQAPRQFQDLTFSVVHPDYIPAIFGCVGSDAAGADGILLPAEDFQNGNATMTLGHGIILTGLVVDASNKPVPFATIVRDHEFHNPAATLETDNAGRFAILNLKPGDMTLTIQAKGFAPQTIPTTVADKMPEIKISLNHGNLLKGRVIDTSGRPVVGAEIRFDRQDLQPLEFDWSATTDKEGRFSWDSAPDGPHAYYMAADGFHALTAPAWVADGQEKIVVLRAESGDNKTVITGTVADVATHDPIDQFTVIVREFPQGDTIIPRPAILGSNGSYAVSVDQNSRAFELEVRAPGYLPEVSPRRFPGDGDQSIDLKLQKGPVITGRIFLPNGAPASAADVALCTERDGAILLQRHFLHAYQTNLTETDADGFFALRPLESAHTIYAIHEQGFAETSLDNTQTPLRLQLSPWGRIEGVATSRGHPVAAARFGILNAYNNPYQRSLSFFGDSFIVQTDDEGRFTISNVPPEEVRLCRVINNTYQNPQFILVQPGDPTKVHYGDTGRLLTGRFILPSFTGELIWTAGQDIQLSSIVVPPPAPHTNNPAIQKKWAIQFWNSRDGKAWQRNQRTFTATMDASGGFRIEDVPPGNYHLHVQLRQSPETGGERIGSLDRDIAIPEALDGPATSPLDLGTIEITPQTALKVGDPAPLFEVKTVRGDPLKLADFRGKYVLLDFWATWCAPCRGETPYLKATYDAFVGDPRFAMIGLSLDDLAGAPIEYAEANNIQWHQGFLGKWSEAAVPNLYNVDGIPSIFLIGPDGKIVARDLRGDAIRDTVSRALGAK